ncbi:hypothetical protein ABKN59_001991 [Abortiporus biennis]
MSVMTDDREVSSERTVGILHVYNPGLGCRKRISLPPFYLCYTRSSHGLFFFVDSLVLDLSTLLGFLSLIFPMLLAVVNAVCSDDLSASTDFSSTVRLPVVFLKISVTRSIRSWYASLIPIHMIDWHVQTTMPVISGFGCQRNEHIPCNTSRSSATDSLHEYSRGSHVFIRYVIGIVGLFGPVYTITMPPREAERWVLCAGDHSPKSD